MLVTAKSSGITVTRYFDYHTLFKGQNMLCVNLRATMDEFDLTRI